MRSNESTIESLVIFLSALTASIASAADYPTPTEGDFTIRDFKFASGETLPSCASIIGRSENRERRAGQNDQCRSGHARDNRQRRANLFARNLPANCLGKDQPLDDKIFHR
jgi:hypothetical protein